jgi:hypothetical protein
MLIYVVDSMASIMAYLHPMLACKDMVDTIRARLRIAGTRLVTRARCTVAIHSKHPAMRSVAPVLETDVS